MIHNTLFNKLLDIISSNQTWKFGSSSGFIATSTGNCSHLGCKYTSRLTYAFL